MTDASFNAFGATFDYHNTVRGKRGKQDEAKQNRPWLVGSAISACAYTKVRVQCGKCYDHTIVLTLIRLRGKEAVQGAIVGSNLFDNLRAVLGCHCLHETSPISLATGPTQEPGLVLRLKLQIPQRSTEAKLGV